MDSGGTEPAYTSIRAQAVVRLADEMGFAMVGIGPAEPSTHRDRYLRWLGAASHGEMTYLTQHVETRLDPGKLVPGARSIICLADVYPDRVESPEDSDAPRGRIARYAWGDDYHDVIKRRLHDIADALRARWPQYDYRSAVDTAPVLEQEHAARAGLGWIGKHTLVLHPRFGSYYLIGEIITTMPLQTAVEAGYPLPTVSAVDRCGTCTRCLDACPTGCITPYEVDATRCISYLTLEHRSAIDPSLHAAMGDWLAGCDVCQEVCPHNDEREPITAHPAYTPRDYAAGIDLLELLSWTEADRRQRFTRSALKRIHFEMLIRNALIAAGNFIAARAELAEQAEQAAARDSDAGADTDDTAALLARIRELAAGDAALIATTARQVLARIEQRAPK